MVRNVFACEKHFMASWDQSLLKLNVEYTLSLLCISEQDFAQFAIIPSEATVMTSYVNMNMNMNCTQTIRSPQPSSLSS